MIHPIPCGRSCTPNTIPPYRTVKEISASGIQLVMLASLIRVELKPCNQTEVIDAAKEIQEMKQPFIV
jgi:hypothetical protein